VGYGREWDDAAVAKQKRTKERTKRSQLIEIELTKPHHEEKGKENHMFFAGKRGLQHACDTLFVR